MITCTLIAVEDNGETALAVVEFVDGDTLLEEKRYPVSGDTLLPELRDLVLADRDAKMAARAAIRTLQAQLPLVIE